MFSVTSRYFNLPTLAFTQADGTSINYVSRRILPQPGRFALLQQYVVGAGDRLDQVAYKFLGDPEQFWRIADANNAIRPEELTLEPGSIILITLPAGIPGAAPNA
jgi:hypothetical protein